MLRFVLPILLVAGACGGDSKQEISEPDADLGRTEFTITNTDASGESHSLTITCEDLQSETAITLVTSGAHQHSIRIEVADLEAIVAGDSVTLTFTEGHEHTFTIEKPADACLGL
jgi:hypothetical protein